MARACRRSRRTCCIWRPPHSRSSRSGPGPSVGASNRVTACVSTATTRQQPARRSWRRSLRPTRGSRAPPAALPWPGPAANALGLATLCPPYGGIYGHEQAHIATDECGAPGFFTGGAQLALVPGEHGKLLPGTFAAALSARPVDVHSVQPAALSLTQATELGTVYRREEIAELCRLAHGRGLKVHME